MPPLDSSLIPPALYFALGGTLLALLQLAIEYRTPRHASRFTLIVGGGLLALASLLWLLGGDWEISLPAALLGSAALLAAVVRLEATRQVFVSLLRPGIVWCLVLAASGAAAVWVRFASVPPVADGDFPIPAATQFHMLEGIVALTDGGRELPLCAYEQSERLLEEERGILGLSQYQHQVIRLVEPRTQCNCHGWVYTQGKYAIRSRDVSTILEDNGYAVVTQPQVGDLAIYRTSTEEVAHTGLVRLVADDGSIFVESKWGPLGVYLHPVASQPYGNRHVYYRSQRAGHVVAVVPSSSTPAEETTLAHVDKFPLDAADTLTATRASPLQRQIYERPIVKVPGQRKT